MGSCWLSLCLCLVFVKSINAGDVQIFQKVLLDCLKSEDKYLCLTDRLARAVQRAINLDVPILEGIITFKRNEEKSLNLTQPRSYNGLSKLTSVISQFLESHILTVDLSKVRQLKDEDDKEELKKGTTISKRERKYFQYTMMVLLGIFGLSAPLIMKTLALIAGKALIASKIALIMVGSIALKKIFQADNDGGGVKVHTHTVPLHDDDHDRYMDVSGYNYHGKGI